MQPGKAGPFPEGEPVCLGFDGEPSPGGQEKGTQERNQPVQGKEGKHTREL